MYATVPLVNQGLQEPNALSVLDMSSVWCRALDAEQLPRRGMFLDVQLVAPEIGLVGLRHDPVRCTPSSAGAVSRAPLHGHWRVLDEGVGMTAAVLEWPHIEEPVSSGLVPGEAGIKVVPSLVKSFQLRLWNKKHPMHMVV